MKKLIFPLLLSVIVALLTGCASSSPPTIYFPSETSDVHAFYKNGLPIGTVNFDSATVMLAMEPASVVGTEYMRLWFLCQNKAQADFLLEPLKCAKLTFIGSKKTYENVEPEAPSVILSHIDNEMAAKMIGQVIGGTLQSIAAEPTTITDPQGGQWKSNDKAEKVNTIVDKTTSSMATTGTMYSLFKSSINSGILRRNTIFPGESVNGYIYFPLPKAFRTSFNDYMTIDPSKYRFVLDLNVQSKNQQVEFTPKIGE